MEKIIIIRMVLGSGGGGGERVESLHSCTHLCRGSEIYYCGLYDVGLGVNLAQTLSQLRVLG